MSMWSLRWHFTNKSVAGAPYSIKGYRYSLSHSQTLWRNFWKFDYEMVHSEVLKNALFACFRFLFFILFPQGGQLTPFAPICGQPCPWFLLQWKSSDYLRSGYAVESCNVRVRENARSRPPWLRRTCLQFPLAVSGLTFSTACWRSPGRHNK